MRSLVPITKIIITVGTAIWALVLHEPYSLSLLCIAELVVLLMARSLFGNIKAVSMLVFFAAFLGGVEYIGGGTETESLVAALRMLAMTLLFVYLLTTTRLQDLTTAMVKQLKIPYEYAFMFTAGLRFIPDFLEENREVAEAQACRGLSVKGNFFKQVKRYMSIVRPLMLRSLGRSETMALSLELRGFGSTERTFMGSVSPKIGDYIMIGVVCLVTVSLVYGRMHCGL